MTASQTLPYDAQELKNYLLPLLDSATNLCESTNKLMTAILNMFMSAQADEICGASKGERSEERVNSRNGYRQRKLNTTFGTLDLRIPKLRTGSYFPSEFLERYSRTEQALASAVAEMYITGTSTRKVEKVAKKFGVESLSKDQVSRLCAVIDNEVDAFLKKDWSYMRFAYLFLDATVIKCRVGGAVKNQSFLTAIGVGDDGKRHFVGFTCANAESYASWSCFLEDLHNRGVNNVRLVTSDAHDGLRRAIEEVYPEAAWQRCIAHVKRDVLAKIDGAEKQKKASAAIAAVFAQTEPKLVRAMYHRAIDVLEDINLRAARVFENAEADALTYLSFPRAHAVRIRTNNVQERMNCELKRRSKVVQTFPSEASAMRLLGGVIDEINADWAAGSRFISVESLEPVLACEEARVIFDEFEPDEDATRQAEVMMRVALDAVKKVA